MRVLVLGSSHCRGVGVLLNHSLNEIKIRADVLTVCKPNGKLVDIVKNIDSLTKNLTKSDIVIICGSTNDINGYDPYVLTIERALHRVAAIEGRCEIKMLNIPYRYDTTHLNHDIWVANQHIKKFCEGRDITFDQFDLPRDLYTNHGLHLNPQGKAHLVQGIVNKFLSSPRSIVDEIVNEMIEKAVLEANLSDLSMNTVVNEPQVFSIPVIMGIGRYNSNSNFYPGNQNRIDTHPTQFFLEQSYWKSKRMRSPPFRAGKSLARN